MNCTRCGSARTQEVRTPEGPHYGKLVCLDCVAFIKWLPTPIKPVNFDKLPCVEAETPLPQLTAVSDAQREFGERMREKLLHRLKGRIDIRLYLAARSITDAPWWISNGKRNTDQIQWPVEWTDDAPSSVTLFPDKPNAESLENS